MSCLMRDPVAVDLVMTGEVVGWICRWCYRDCNETGQHKPPPLLTEKLHRRQTWDMGPN